MKELGNLDYCNHGGCDEDASTIWQLLNRLKELDMYVACIEEIKEVLKNEDIKSEGLCNMQSEVLRIYSDSCFDALKEDLSRIVNDISKIKSLTLEINLDRNLNPSSVKLVSFNEKEFDNKVGILDRFTKLSVNYVRASGGDVQALVNPGQTNVAPTDPLMSNLTREVEKLLKGVVKDLRNTLKKYVDVSGYEFIQIVPQLVFYLRWAENICMLKENGMNMVEPRLITRNEGKTDNMSIKDMFNIKLAFHYIEEKESLKNIVLNDIDYTDDKRVYILTGPNRGGKTTYSQGVGLCVYMAQLGLYVPASFMEYTPVDAIFTHFPADENKTVELGRLGEETRR